VENRDRQFAEIFMQAMSPAFMARIEDEEAFQTLLETEASKSHAFF